MIFIVLIIFKLKISFIKKEYINKSLEEKEILIIKIILKKL